MNWLLSIPRAFILIVPLTCLSIENLRAAEGMRLQEAVPIGILNIIFQVRFNGESGSAFAVDVDNKQYIVSARHIFQTTKNGTLQTIKDGDTLELLIRGKWQPVVVRPILPVLAKTDIIAFAPDKIVAPKIPVMAGLGGVRLGQDVYFLGFPFGLGSRDARTAGAIPFVKKGVFSAGDSTDDSGRVIYIDGHNNPGFSGGPIIFANFDKGRALQIGGVISGYRHHPSPVIEIAVDIPSAESSKKARVPVVLENTGIVVGYMIDEILKAIRLSPIGFPLPEQNSK